MDASLVEVPSSTQNRIGGRGPERRQTKQGNHWHFGTKAPIGVDSHCGLTHSLATPLANVSEVAAAHAVLHGRGDRVCGDGGQEGVGKGAEHRDAAVDWRVAMQRGQGRLLDQLD